MRLWGSGKFPCEYLRTVGETLVLFLKFCPLMCEAHDLYGLIFGGIRELDLVGWPLVVMVGQTIVRMSNLLPGGRWPLGRHALYVRRDLFVQSFYSIIDRSAVKPASSPDEPINGDRLWESDLQPGGSRFIRSPEDVAFRDAVNQPVGKLRPPTYRMA